jgi:2-polyprenyl-3-methyl-5-hydroxy-6-metoxy-1,4-benzoquinol methylase
MEESKREAERADAGGLRIAQQPAALPKAFADNLNLFSCPGCSGDLAAAGRALKCAKCGHQFELDGRIPLLFWPNEGWLPNSDVTDIVKAFYEENPFPNYDDQDSAETLREKARRGIFAKLLDDQIPPYAKVLEVGCGTGQLTNFLACCSTRTLFGADMCLNSLRLGDNFRYDNGLNNLGFCQMNLFRPVFRNGAFDVVISNGVLHHTSDPFGGFKSISKLVKPGGIIMIGLYNKYGRLLTDVRRFLFNTFGEGLTFFDSRLRDKSLDETRRRTWFMDQYKHPHESKHTYREVLEWFDRTGFRFLNSVPKSRGGQLSPNESLFEPHSRGSSFDHFLVQSSQIIKGAREGGLFVMIGRRELGAAQDEKNL